MSRTYPERPWIGVGAVVWKDDRVLLARRAKAPKAGQWSLPGGAQEAGETVAETAAREVREETGLEIDVLGLIDVIDSIERDDEGAVRFHYTLIDLCARWRSGEARAAEDASEVGWFTLEQVRTLGLWTETVRVIEKSRAFL